MLYNYFGLNGKYGLVYVNWVWRTRKRDMERAWSSMTKQSFDEDYVGNLGCMCKVKGKNVFYVAVSGTGRNLLDTIIHEACHVGQCFSKNREVAAELAARVAGFIISELKKDNRCKL